MIEVAVKLLKGSIYLTGEVVECIITFSHPPSPSHKVSQSHSDVFESLAWASAQITCQCTTDIKLNKQEEPPKTDHLLNDTALSSCVTDSGYIELATKPKILFCDLRLSPGQFKSCK